MNIGYGEKLQVREGLLAQAAAERYGSEPAVSDLDLEETAGLRLPRERGIVESFARGGDEEAIECFAAEYAFGDIRDRQVQHRTHSPVGVESRNARAAPMAAPDAVVGIDRKAVRVALVWSNSCEHARRAGDASVTQVDAQDASADRVDEVTKRTVRVEGRPVRDDERGFDLLARARAGEAEEMAGRRAFADVHRAEPEGAVGMTAAVVDAHTVARAWQVTRLRQFTRARIEQEGARSRCAEQTAIRRRCKRRNRERQVADFGVRAGGDMAEYAGALDVHPVDGAFAGDPDRTLAERGVRRRDAAGQGRGGYGGHQCEFRGVPKRSTMRWKSPRVRSVAPSSSAVTRSR